VTTDMQLTGVFGITHDCIVLYACTKNLAVILILKYFCFWFLVHVSRFYIKTIRAAKFLTVWNRSVTNVGFCISGSSLGIYAWW